MSALSQLMRVALGKRLPKHDGRLAVPGLRAEAIIRRDGHGVPYIRAESEHDGWFALGFCHGQDRPLQLEITLRAVRGTLSALVGPDGVGVDRLSRRIGFRRAAERQLPRLRPEIRAQIAAYVRGINAAHGVSPRPHGLVLLGQPPTLWEPLDVHGFVVLFCFALAANWDAELMRLKVLVEDGPEALAALEPSYPIDMPSTDRPLNEVGAALDHLGADLVAFRELMGFGGGSNAWAIAPQHSATGRPILANDPHLMSQAPPLNYLAQIRAPGLEVAGASWVGLPAFGPGHNGFAAWGVTAAHGDNTDLFLEEIGPDGASIREGDTFVPCPRREERIAVRGGDDVVEWVLEGPRGPVIAGSADTMLPDLTLPNGRPNALSMAATWLAPRPYCGLYRAFEARSFEAFRELFREGSTSGVCAVYADETGTIGYQLGMEIPERPLGHGKVPLPGWRPESAWGPLIPFDAMPQRRDPEEGFVCTANNQPLPNGEAPYLGADWLDGYRQQAIARALAARSDWTLEANLDLQRDTTSIPWEQMRSAVLALDPGSDADARVGLALLRHWNGQLASHSLIASVYVLFLVELCDRVVRAKAPRAAAWAMGKAFTEMLPHSTVANRRTAHLVRLVREQPPGWFDDWPATLTETLGDAVRELRRRHGDDPANWAWGKVRPLTLHHPLHEVPALGAIFDIGPFDGAGDNSTISQGGLDFTAPLDNQAWLPAMRAVLDVGNWDATRMAILGGQSGNPLSPHYVDQAGAWHGEASLTLSWTEPAIAERCRKTLTLTPDV